jgi:pimeloyl-ACP methyl ester carboxylesterase
MSEDDVAAAKSAASWPSRVAAAHTVVRELEAHNRYRVDPARFSGWTVPTLLCGADSDSAEVASTCLLAATLPGSRTSTLPGEGYVAMLTAPDLFSAAVLDFLHGES